MHRKIPVHLLGVGAFCEIQLFLREVLGVRKQATRKMIRGKREHEKLVNKFKPEKTMSLYEAFELSSKEGIAIRAREVPVSGKYLFGFVDELLIMPDSFVVIEDKISGKVFSGSLIQVFGYCMSLSERFDNAVIYGVIRKIPEMRIQYLGLFGEREYRTGMKYLKRTLDILSGGTPQFHGNFEKCRKCNMNGVCSDIFPKNMQF